MPQYIVYPSNTWNQATLNQRAILLQQIRVRAPIIGRYIASDWEQLPIPIQNRLNKMLGGGRAEQNPAIDKYMVKGEYPDTAAGAIKLLREVGRKGLISPRENLEVIRDPNVRGVWLVLNHKNKMAFITYNSRADFEDVDYAMAVLKYSNKPREQNPATYEQIENVIFKHLSDVKTWAEHPAMRTRPKAVRNRLKRSWDHAMELYRNALNQEDRIAFDKKYVASGILLKGGKVGMDLVKAVCQEVVKRSSGSAFTSTYRPEVETVPLTEEDEDEYEPAPMEAEQNPSLPPGAPPKKVEIAEMVYNKFHDFEPSKIEKIELPKPKVVVKLGDFVSVGYFSDKWRNERKFKQKHRGKKGQFYVHEFKDEKNRVVAFAPDDNNPEFGTLICWGKVRVTPHGIEDMKK